MTRLDRVLAAATAAGRYLSVIHSIEVWLRRRPDNVGQDDCMLLAADGGLVAKVRLKRWRDRFGQGYLVAVDDEDPDQIVVGIPLRGAQSQ